MTKTRQFLTGNPRLKAVSSRPLILLLAVSIAFAVARLVVHPTPVGDFTYTWQQQVDAILHGGTPYVDAWDNKTPIWQYIHALTELTPDRHLTFIALITVANAVSAYLLGRLGKQLGVSQSVLVVGLLYLVLLGNFHGFTVNSRQFATLFLLLGLFSRRPLVIGVSTGVACLMHQYYGLLIPVVVAYHWWFEDADMSTGWLARFSGGGLGVVILTYLSLLAWGIPALMAAIDYSVFGMVGYIERGMATSNAIWRTPLQWFSYVTLPVRMSPGVMAIGVAFLYGSWVVWNRYQKAARWLAIFFIAAVIPLAVNPARSYLMVPAVAVAIVAEFGISSLFPSTDEHS